MKKVILTAIITIIICISMLFVMALIPQSAIKDNVNRSADEFLEMEMFDHVTSNVFPSRQDNYADLILVDIIYSIDKNNMIKSLVTMPYFAPENIVTSGTLKETVESGKTAFDEGGMLTTEYVDYSRYWHGSQILIRPLLTIMPIKAIRMVLGCILLAMTVALFVLMCRDKYKCFAACYVAAMAVLSAWMCAFCIEYITTFLIMGIQLLILYTNRKKISRVSLYMILCAGGIATAFMDFLTTETITFTMPMLLYFVIIEANDGRGVDEILPGDRRNWMTLLTGAIIWGISYAGMMLLKWMIAMAVLGKDAFLNALSQASLRIAGDATYGNIPGAETVSDKERVTGALWRNLACLFPTGESVSKSNTILYTLIMLFVIFAVWYLFHKKLDRGSGQLTLILLVLALIPYIRFLVLNNHAYIHFFFTYRAQIVTITALLYLAFKNVPFAGNLRVKKSKK